MSYQSRPGEVRLRVIDPGTVLSAAASYASPTWGIGAYRRIVGVVQLTSWTGAMITFQGGFAASTGRTGGTRIAATAFSDSADMYLNFGASSPSRGWISFEVYPLTTGAPRGGWSHSMAVDTATGLVTDANNLNFQNSDLTTGVTGIGITFFTSNATGTIRLLGEPT